MKKTKRSNALANDNTPIKPIADEQLNNVKGGHADRGAGKPGAHRDSGPTGMW